MASAFFRWSLNCGAGHRGRLAGVLNRKHWTYASGAPPTVGECDSCWPKLQTLLSPGRLPHLGGLAVVVAVVVRPALLRFERLGRLGRLLLLALGQAWGGAGVGWVGGCCLQQV